jgi:hypothetical protein
MGAETHKDEAMKKNRFGRPGFALVIVLMIGFIAAAVAMTINATAAGSVMSTAHTAEAEEARSLALFGLERANAYVFPFEELTGDYDALLDPGLIAGGTALANCASSVAICSAPAENSTGRACNLPVYTDSGAKNVLYEGLFYRMVPYGGGAYLTRFDDDADDLINDPSSGGKTGLNDLWNSQTNNNCADSKKCREGPGTAAACGLSTPFDNPFRDRNRSVSVTVIGIAPGTNPAKATHRVTFRQVFTMQAPPSITAFEVGGNLNINTRTSAYFCAPNATVGVNEQVRINGSASNSAGTDANATSCYCGDARSVNGMSMPQCDITNVNNSTCTTLTDCSFGDGKAERQPFSEPKFDTYCSNPSSEDPLCAETEQAMVPLAPAPASGEVFTLGKHGVSSEQTTTAGVTTGGAARAEFAFNLQRSCNFWIGTSGHPSKVFGGDNLPVWYRGSVASTDFVVTPSSTPTTYNSVTVNTDRSWGTNVLAASQLSIRFLHGTDSSKTRVAKITSNEAATGTEAATDTMLIVFAPIDSNDFDQFEIFSNKADANLPGAINVVAYFWDAKIEDPNGQKCGALPYDPQPLPIPNPYEKSDGPYAGRGQCWVPFIMGRVPPTTAAGYHVDGSNLTCTPSTNWTIEPAAAKPEVDETCRWRPKEGKRTLKVSLFSDPIIALPRVITGPGVTEYELPSWESCTIAFPGQDLDAKKIPKDMSCKTGATKWGGSCNGANVAMSWDRRESTYFIGESHCDAFAPGAACPFPKQGANFFKSATVGAVVVGSYYFGNSINVGGAHTFAHTRPANLSETTSGALQRANFALSVFPKATIVVDGNFALASNGAGPFWLGAGTASGSAASRTDAGPEAFSRYAAVIAGGNVVLGSGVFRSAGSIWAGSNFTWYIAPYSVFYGPSAVLDGEVHVRRDVNLTGTGGAGAAFGRFYWNYINPLQDERRGSLLELEYVTPPLRAPSAE